MNKFQKLISDNSSATLQRRAGALTTQAEIAQQTVVNALRNQVSNLKLKVESLTDFAPDSTDSLKVGTKDWNPEKWATDLQKTKWELYLAEKQLAIAETTYKEYFIEDKEEIKG